MGRWSARSSRSWAITAAFLGLCVVIRPALSGQSQDLQGQSPYQDTTLDFEARARDLVSRMTRRGEGLAAHERRGGDPAARACPAYEWWNECLHGVARAGRRHRLPAGDRPGRHLRRAAHARDGERHRDEARAKHHEFVRQGKRGRYQGLTFWSPNINIFRDPRWGRGQETYGEDPFLTGRHGRRVREGPAGRRPALLKVIATAKHYAVHSGPEPDRHHFDARPSERDLYETYLPAFRALVQEAQGRVGDGRLQPRQRRVGLGQPAPAPGHPAAGVGLRRATWCRTAAPSTTSSCATSSWRRPRRPSALGRHEGLRPRVRQRLPGARQGARARPARRGATSTWRCARLMLARMRLGMFDPPERVRYARDPVLRERRRPSTTGSRGAWRRSRSSS